MINEEGDDWDVEDNDGYYNIDEIGVSYFNVRRF
jgi:hypothetical protein